MTDALGNSTNYTYDAAGNLLTQTDGNGNTTTYTYNRASLVTSKTDPAGYAESYTYYANGKMKEKTDRNGIGTSYNYDIFGRLLTEDAGGQVQSYTYDANGNLLTMTDGTGTTTRTYDALNRNISKDVPAIGNSIYEYDLVTDNQGEHAERITDPKGNATSKTYDRVGRLSKVTADGRNTQYEYYNNGNRQSVRYPDGTTEAYTYDKNNRITGLANTKVNGSVISTYQYTYDATGNQLTKTESKGTTTYTYDGNNRLSTVTEPEGKVTNYTYDAAGNQLTKTESKGTTTYTYDENNRLSTVTEPEGKVTSYTYDNAGNRRSEQVEYGLISMTNLYSYDECGRLATTISTDGTEIRYLYDRNGNLSSRSVGKMEIISPDELSEEMLPEFDLIINKGEAGGTGTEKLALYHYDNYNRLESLKSGNSTTAYRYNAQGYRVEKKVNSNTTRYLYEYDKVVLETDGSNNQTAYQVYGTNLLYRSTTGEASNGAQSYYYLYNAHGDVTSLLDMSGNIAVSYDYDAFGNIIGQTGTADNPIRYAGYQYDEESGLYYLNARYYDSVTARFITEDSYTGERNDPLSLNLYTYCQNNPIKYDDPSGHSIRSIGFMAGLPIISMVPVLGLLPAADLNTKTDTNGETNNVKPSGSVIDYSKINSDYWNRNDGYFTDNWWQDDKKLQEATSKLRSEIKKYGEMPLNTNMGYSYFGQLKNQRMYAIQALTGSLRTGYYDDNTLAQLENIFTVYGLDFSDAKHHINLEAFNTIEQWYEKIYQGNPDWLENGGADIIAGFSILGSAYAINYFGSKSFSLWNVFKKSNGAANPRVGYHATRPEYAESIQTNGFRESTSGRAGGGGVYVNNTPEGAIAEYRKYNPKGPEPTIFKVEYNAGTNVKIENPGSHITGPIPINGDSLTFESTQMPGTYNTIVRNGTIKITGTLK